MPCFLPCFLLPTPKISRMLMISIILSFKIFFSFIFIRVSFTAMAVSNKFVHLQQIKYDLFKAQNPENGHFDVMLEVEGKVCYYLYHHFSDNNIFWILYAHKNMLNLLSETFNAMLSDRWNTKKDEPIKVQNYSYDDFYQFLTFLYSAQCQLSNGSIHVMLDMAEFYGVDLFKTYCTDYMSSMKITIENIFAIMESTDKYSIIQLKAVTRYFIAKNFQSIFDADGFMMLRKDLVEEIIVAAKDKAKPENLFQAVYKWAEKQAKDKQVADPNLNLDDTIKAQISVFLPHIYFHGMTLKFLEECVVPKRFIFSPADELNKILNDIRSQPTVIVTNVGRQALYGKLIPYKTVIDDVKSLRSMNSYDSDTKGCWWQPKFKVPSTPSPLEKRISCPNAKGAGDIWYLIYYPDGNIGVLHSSLITEKCYLIAEMTAKWGFQMSRGCEVQIV